MTYIGIRERRLGKVTILDADPQVRIGLRFGASAVTLSKAIQSLLEQGQDQILLNLKDVFHLDARGLAEIVSAGVVINEQGGRFKLLRLTGRVRDLMTKAQLLTNFETYEDEARAVESFETGSFAASHKPRVELTGGAKA